MEKAGVILINNKGFSLIETLVALSIIMMVTTTMIPITTLLMAERDVLEEKRILSTMLHDELQYYLWSEDATIPASYDKKVNGTVASLHFSSDKSLLKGCVKWGNVKNKQEEICLYGYRFR